jgi:oligopeptide/dipeptide ABC transporter ATP-binding protein
MSGVGAKPLIAVQDLHHVFLEKRFGRLKRTRALRGVDLDLFDGECLAVVGESGSGKTTLARVLLRLVRPTRGRVLFRGQDVLAFGAQELRRYRRAVQIVFQDPFGSLNPRLRAGQMLEEVLRVHHPDLGKEERRGRAEELLAKVGLKAEYVHRYPHELSGGQRQRLGIARALSVEPEILVLDEPVSALDLSIQAQILNLLEELRGALGLTYVFISHDLSVVRQAADRVAVLYLGRVVETAMVAELFRDPRHPYTRGLLMAADPPPEPESNRSAWAILPGEPPSPAHPPEGCAFHPRCPHPAKGPECRTRVPPLAPVEGGRSAACWKVEEHLACP